MTAHKTHEKQSGSLLCTLCKLPISAPIPEHVETHRTIALEEDMTVLRGSMIEAIRLLEVGLPAGDILRNALASTDRTSKRTVGPWHCAHINSRPSDSVPAEVCNDCGALFRRRP